MTTDKSLKVPACAESWEQVWCQQLCSFQMPFSKFSVLALLAVWHL